MGLQETATGCRERCGGQGYLSCNRFGQILGFAHAGMTAEGDNTVLMMKVAKEYLSTLHLPATKQRVQQASQTPAVSGKHGPLSQDTFFLAFQREPILGIQDIGVRESRGGVLESSMWNHLRQCTMQRKP